MCRHALTHAYLATTSRFTNAAQMVPVKEITVDVRGDKVRHAQSTDVWSSIPHMVLVDGHADMGAHTFAEHAKDQAKYVLHKYWVHFGGRGALSDTFTRNTSFGSMHELSLIHI